MEKTVRIRVEWDVAPSLVFTVGSVTPRTWPWATWGQELELSEEMPILSTVQWHYDQSGPPEFSYGPMALGDLGDVLWLTSEQLEGRWDLEPHEQMGCHIHYRPQKPHTRWRPALAFALGLPAFSVWILGSFIGERDGTALRETWRRWAPYREDLLSLARSGPIDMKNYLRRCLDGGERYYGIVTVNCRRSPAKPVATVEYRLSEAHPIRASLYVALVAVADVSNAVDVTNATPAPLIDQYAKAADEGVRADDVVEGAAVNGLGTRYSISQLAEYFAKLLMDHGFDAEAYVLMYLMRREIGGAALTEREDVEKFLRSDEGAMWLKAVKARYGL